MKNIFLMLLLTLTGTACQSGIEKVTPTSDALAPYYGAPRPINIVSNGETYVSAIGTYSWITDVSPDGITAITHADAFAIITPSKPIPLTSNPSFTLKLPVPVNPTELWYALFKVSEDDLEKQDAAYGSFRWIPDHKTQTYHEQTNLSLLSEQDVSFYLDPGIYVLEVHAGWRGIQADYGFLLRVQK